VACTQATPKSKSPKILITEENSSSALPLTTTSQVTKFCTVLTQDGEYILSHQDKVKVAVLDEQTLSGKFTIDNKGMITMPLIGDVGIEGCTTTQAKQIIADRYADGYLLNPNISVEIDAYKPIYVIGEVRTPGEFEYSLDMNVLKAVALAGGFTYRANKKSIPILRKDSNGMTYQDTYPANAEIIPGDIITIKERLF